MKLPPNIDRRLLRAAVRRRRRNASLLPPAVGLAIFIVCLGIYARLAQTTLGEQVVDTLLELGAIVEFLAICFGIAIPIILASIVYVGLERIFIGNEVRRCRLAPCCVWCEHSLRGHAVARSSWITCPECGRASPVTTAPSTTSEPDDGLASS